MEGRIVESRLFGVAPFDPVSVSITIASILLLTIVASLLPAFRAARVDPMRSLRVE